MLRRISRGIAGRAYEIGLKAGVVPYRRPFQYYNRDVWDAGFASGEHDHYEGLSDRARYAAIAGYLGAIDGPLDILDMGCGTGVMRTRVPEEKVRYYQGIDTAPSAIAQANNRGFDRTEFLCRPRPNRKDFDAAICNEMLYLVEDIDGFLVDLKSDLKPGGLLITSNTRFHGDFHMRERIADHFTLLDETMVLNPAHKRKWRVGCYQVGISG